MLVFPLAPLLDTRVACASAPLVLPFSFLLIGPRALWPRSHLLLFLSLRFCYAMSCRNLKHARQSLGFFFFWSIQGRTHTVNRASTERGMLHATNAKPYKGFCRNAALIHIKTDSLDH